MGMIELKEFRTRDTDAVIALFTDTVHQVNTRDYTAEQLSAWAPHKADTAAWIDRLQGQFTQLAWQDGKLLGFGTLTEKGLVDYLYIHHEHLRQGLASLIYLRLEFEALEKGLKRMFTESSMTARPFFEKMGFSVVFPRDKQLRGSVLKNFVMEKALSAHSQ